MKMMFGEVNLAKIRDSSDLKGMLEGFPESEFVIVKPNWFSLQPANFIEVNVLRMLLEALDSRVVVTEGYTLEKNDGSLKFTVDGDDVNWNWVIEHPSWDWIKEEGRWNELRRQDNWFLDEYGFTDLFQEFGVEYVNVTEEIWKGEIADPAKVKEAVEARYEPAFTDQIYGFLPKRLHELRGSPLISLEGQGHRRELPEPHAEEPFRLHPGPPEIMVARKQGRETRQEHNRHHQSLRGLLRSLRDMRSRQHSDGEQP